MGFIYLIYFNHAKILGRDFSLSYLPLNYQKAGKKNQIS